ncbi:RuvC-like Holliday junction resolvase [Salmonella phage SPLA10]|nr:RuvC-like Holliday junction resolvase [Salmonella phage SPLA10]
MNLPRFRSLGLDPGSRNLGYGVVDVDLETVVHSRLITNVTHMGNLLVDNMMRYNSAKWWQRTERQQRLKCGGDYAVGLIETYQPDIVVLEDAYLNRRQPRSYRSLSEGLIYLVEAIRDYDDTLPVLITEAVRAKKAVGANPKKGCDQKQIVKDALLNNRDIILPDDFEEEAEHAIDGVALAQFGINEWWEENKYFY